MQGYLVRVAEMHHEFRARIDRLPQPAQLDAGIVAVRAFLDARPLETLAADPLWEEMQKGNPLVAFRHIGDLGLVCQRAPVVAAAAFHSNSEHDVASDASSICSPRRRRICVLYRATLMTPRGSSIASATSVRAARESRRDRETCAH